MPRDYATDAALRPQPKREGPDHWVTPDCLDRGARHPHPAGSATSAGLGTSGRGRRLVRAIATAGYRVVAGDLATGHDFSERHAATALRQPDHQSAVFIELDRFLDRAMCHFSRPGQPTVGCRAVAAVGRVDGEVPGAGSAGVPAAFMSAPGGRAGSRSTTSPRWSFCWGVWLRGTPLSPKLNWLDRS